MAGQGFFEKGYRHAARHHPIAHAAFKRSQGAIALVRTA